MFLRDQLALPTYFQLSTAKISTNYDVLIELLKVRLKYFDTARNNMILYV
jgi:hypothetical protein